MFIKLFLFFFFREDKTCPRKIRIFRDLRFHGLQNMAKTL